jgi:hypothetical protein
MDMHTALLRADGITMRRVADLLDRLAGSGDAETCYCKAHRGECPGDDCDGCPDCPTGQARSIIVALEEETS